MLRSCAVLQAIVVASLLGCDGGRRSPVAGGSGTGARTLDATLSADAELPSDGAELAPDLWGTPSDAASASSDGGVRGADGGPRFDGGLRVDVGHPLDIGHMSFDAGLAPDAASPGSASGLEAYCRGPYFDCGGSFYATPEACVRASTNFWGTCASRLTLLDAFSDCLSAIPCSSYNPDAYNPANTECAPQWAALGSSPGC